MLLAKRNSNAYLREFDVLATPVEFFRDSTNKGYPFLDEKRVVTVFTMAMYNKNHHVSSQPHDAPYRNFIYSKELFNDFSKGNDGWHHYVVTWSPDETQLFIDGKEQGKGSGKFLDNHEKSEMAIASRENEKHGQGWNGEIDDLKIYNYVLVKGLGVIYARDG